MQTEQILPPVSEWFYWECPQCGSVHKDPNDFRQTSCENGHVVQLGHESKGWQTATLVEELTDSSLADSKLNAGGAV